jgi:hypothetical protein
VKAVHKVVEEEGLANAFLAIENKDIGMLNTRSDRMSKKLVAKRDVLRADEEERGIVVKEERRVCTA